MNEREISYNEFHGVGSQCQICSRNIDGRKGVLACVICFTKVKNEYIELRKAHSMKEEDEESQSKYWPSIHRYHFEIKE